MTPELTLGWRARLWDWFTQLAQKPHALWWLAVAAGLDPIFSPLAPEIYLVALMLAHPVRWKSYLSVSVVASTVGAAVGYYVGKFLFHQFGLPLLHFYHLEGAFREAQHLIMGHVFIAMIIAAFSPIPEKVVVLAAGFLGVHFRPFIIGFFVGRSIRLAVITYLAQRFGKQIIVFLHKYFMYFIGFVFALLLWYGIVHWHLLPW
jgi:membrane protein YqaA with SNARE-associated domain